MHAYIDLLKGTEKTQGTKENSPLEKGSAYTAAAMCFTSRCRCMPLATEMLVVVTVTGSCISK